MVIFIKAFPLLVLYLPLYVYRDFQNKGLAKYSGNHIRSLSLSSDIQ